jgi:RNA polymerase sigma-70 factor, ECF subfamily
MPRAPSNLVNGAVEGHQDLALAERCRAGAPGAFEELYRIHAPRLFGLACRMVGRGQAEDLLQDIFLTAHRKLGQYKGESSLGTWLFRLATNLCLDHLRSRGARFAGLTGPLPDEPEAAGGIRAGAILGVVDRLDLERALASLPAGCRAVFVLHDVEGYEHREIAEMIGIADGTSKSQLHKARIRLRQALAGDRPPAGECA